MWSHRNGRVTQELFFMVFHFKCVFTWICDLTFEFFHLNQTSKIEILLSENTISY